MNITALPNVRARFESCQRRARAASRSAGVGSVGIGWWFRFVYQLK